MRRLARDIQRRLDILCLVLVHGENVRKGEEILIGGGGRRGKRLDEK